MSSRLSDHAVRRFASHETFAPRFGWLRKAHAAVWADTQGDDARSSDAFLRKTAPVELGVGKNMVTAIRYWSQAFGIIVESREASTGRSFVASTTAEGDWLLADDGADPWLEHPASLWLLHWWLLRDRSLAPTWWVAFNLLPSSTFHEDDLTNLTEAQIALAGWEAVTRASISKDADCIAKMYARRRVADSGRNALEDLLDCPFRELGLLEAVPGKSKTWRFSDAPRSSVPAAIVGYAVVDHLRSSGASQMTLARLAYEPGAVGRAFRLSEPDLVQALKQVQIDHPQVQLVESLGQASISVDSMLLDAPHLILAALYTTAAAPSGAVDTGVNQ